MRLRSSSLSSSGNSTFPRSLKTTEIPKFFTIGQVAEALDVNPRTVRRWIKRGELIAYRVGGVVRIAEGDLRVFLARFRDL
jgi:excisionase family DNA binding protein